MWLASGGVRAAQAEHSRSKWTGWWWCAPKNAPPAAASQMRDELRGVVECAAATPDDYKYNNVFATRRRRSLVYCRTKTTPKKHRNWVRR